MSEENQKVVIQKLSVCLANSYVLYLKTQNYHWNVRGPHFYSLHNLFEEQYKDLAAAIDEIAERIRALGASAPGSFKAFSVLATLEEAKDEASANDMLKDLVESQQHITACMSETIKAAEEVGDYATADLLTQRLAVHQKNHWMLASSLG